RSAAAPRPPPTWPTSSSGWPTSGAAVTTAPSPRCIAIEPESAVQDVQGIDHRLSGTTVELSAARGGQPGHLPHRQGGVIRCRERLAARESLGCRIDRAGGYEL